MSGEQRMTRAQRHKIATEAKLVKSIGLMGTMERMEQSHAELVDLVEHLELLLAQRSTDLAEQHFARSVSDRKLRTIESDLQRMRHDIDRAVTTALTRARRKVVTHD